MKTSFKKTLLLSPLLLLFSACTDIEVIIKGYNKINTDTNYTYSAQIQSDDEEVIIESYRWRVSPQSSAIRLDGINSKTLHVKSVKAGDYTLHIKAQSQDKTYVTQMKIYAQKADVLHGYTLPPEPDPLINNTTLAGIDSNDNGVRDDVERKIYQSYDKEVSRKYVMQDARTTQAVMEDPEAVEHNMALLAKSDFSSGCSAYLKYDLNITDVDGALDFNDEATITTKDRYRHYSKYNHSFSGGVYDINMSLNAESSCDFNVTKALEYKERP